MAANYHLRPPYTEELFTTLAGLMPADSGTVLDLGCGTGDVSLGLLGAAERIVAVDPSHAMLNVARHRPSADDPRIHWIRSRAEDFEFAGPYSLAVAAESLKWMDWEIVLPGIGRALEPNCFLAIVSGRNFVGVPWADQLLSLIPRYSTNRDYKPLDLLEELEARELFREVGRHTTLEAPHAQSVSDYVESIHTRNGFSRQRMNPVAQVEFDAAVIELVSPYARDGVYHGVVQSEVIWGVPLVSS